MEKIAFKMKLKNCCRDEYIKRHNNIWLELIRLLKSKGFSDYSIFLDKETDTHFAVQNQSDRYSSPDMGKEEIVQNWWKYMSDLMETNPNLSPVTVKMEKVFHMD